MKKILNTAAAIGMMTMIAAACQENEDFASATSSKETLVNANQDLTNGYNVLIYGQDTLQMCNLPLNTNEPVKATSEHGLIQMTCTHNAKGQVVLVPSLTTAQNDVIEDVIHIEAQDGSNQTKDISVIIRPYSMATRSVSTTDVKGRLTEVLSYGMIDGFVPGDQVTKHPMLDKTCMAKYVEEHDNFGQGGYSFKAYGTSINELIHDWSVNAKATFPVGEVPVMANVGLGFSKSDKTRNEREYMNIESGERKAYGVFNDTIVSRVDKGSAFWRRVLDSNLNDYLNNAVEGAGKKYSLDEEGAIALIKAYGTHLPTEVLLGGSCRLESSKTMDLTESSFETSVSLGVTLMGEKAAGFKDADDLATQKNKADISKTLGNDKPGGTIEFKDKQTKISQTTDGNEEIVTVGANGKFEGGSWKVSQNVNDWEALAYSYGHMAEKAKYIPIYELIDSTLIDKRSKHFNPNVLKRYESLVNVMKIMEDGYPRYMRSFGTLPAITDKEGEYVICDFVYKWETTPDGQPFVGQVTNKQGNSVNVMYYPMCWNENNKVIGSASNDWSYTTFDALRDTFISLGRCAEYQHFYYAMLPASESYGIDAITFVPEASSEGRVFTSTENRGNDYRSAGWTRRTIGGYTCSEGIRSATCDKVVPYVRYRNANSKSKPITSVCLFNQRSGSDRIMSTSGGTEYNSMNQYSTKRYNEFWVNTTLDKCNTVDNGSVDYNHWYMYKNTGDNMLNQRNYYKTDTECQYSWYRATCFVNQNNFIYVGYSYRPLKMTQKVNDKIKPIKAMLPVKYPK